MIIGIDLGTTNSAAAYMSENGPRLIPNALGDVLTPSVVGIDKEGHVLVGRAAREYAVLHPDRCASLFKRHMGSDWTCTLNGNKFTPETLSSLVLRSLKEDAEANFSEPVPQAVITVPAYFNDTQRKATIRAGQMAGLQVDRIINEPTAASIAYGLHEGSEDKIVVVFDLGGGTFDVSVVELFEGAIEVRASAGESFLGGEDFTRTMAARVLNSQGIMFERAELESPAIVSRVIQQCEAAKQQLTKNQSATVRIPDAKGDLTDNSPQVSISRDEFDQWTASILSRIELPIRRGLGDANLKRTDVNEVILVGGATRMPAVVDRVRHLFQQEPHCRLNPDQVVALGAAVQAGLIARDAQLEDMVVTDVTPFTMGIEISKRIGMDYRTGFYLPVIHRNSTIPISRVKSVETLHASQTQLHVKVYQGESRKVDDNLMLGDFVVQDVPRGPAGQRIDVRFTYDLNGVLEVEALIFETQKKASLVIANHAKGMSKDQIARAVEEMQTLKMHPREESANRFLLKRAERIYRELPLREREVLADLIDGFEEALELQDKEAIARFCDALGEHLDHFENRLGYEQDEEDDQSW